MIQTRLIDLNTDVGEYPDLIESGFQDRMMKFATSVNVSCGAHAGDEETLRATLAQARSMGLRVGAHPSYPDRAGFGRSEMQISSTDLKSSIAEQLRTLGELAAFEGVELSHVKPHGALYNVAARDESVATAICEAVLSSWKSPSMQKPPILIGLAGSRFLDIAKSHGLQVEREGFVDRAYESDGSLRQRSLPGALITDPEACGRQAITLSQSGRVDTLCLHMDTPRAGEIAEAVLRMLRSTRGTP